MDQYDIVIIGAGSGGISAALSAIEYGQKVLLIDKDKPGGECTWSGCVPSKALINEAKKVHTIKKSVKNFSYDNKVALDHVHAVRERIYSHETPDVFLKFGIEYLQGRASFKNSKTLLVGDREIHGKKYIISTGSSAFIPSIEGIDSISYLTNESIFELERLPESLIILGGGPIGIELAQAVCRLGTKVQLVEMIPVLVFREEMDFSHAIQKKLTEEGVELHLGAKAVHIYGEGNQIFLTYDNDDEDRIIRAESLLVAVGRKPNLDGLGLDRAGIKYGREGIHVNNYLQTSQPNIYAIGDVVGPYQFSHMANAQGVLATHNAIFPFKRKISYDNVAWVTFTEPEIARAGLTESEARKSFGDDIRIYDYDFNHLDRAVTVGETIERMKVILDRKGKVLGVSILADRAGELIGEIQLLKSLGMNFAKMGTVIHPYPTYSDVFSILGKRVMEDNLLKNPIVKLFRKYMRK